MRTTFQREDDDRVWQPGLARMSTLDSDDAPLGWSMDSRSLFTPGATCRMTILPKAIQRQGE